MFCPKEIRHLMHKHLDHEISESEQQALKDHLATCSSCQEHFHELKRTASLLGSTSNVHPSGDFINKVINCLPKEKKVVKYKRWLRNHPAITAAAIFFLLMFSSLYSVWSEDGKLTVSKQHQVVLQDNTVIVPKGETIKGDLVIQNGNVKIDGKVNGNVTIINGKSLLASAGEVTGDIDEVNKIFEWIWYQMKETINKIISF